MTTPHKATPSQWEYAGRIAGDTRACLLELRDRIAELEGDATEHSKSAHFCFETIIQRIEALEGNHPAKPDSSPASAGGLMQAVGAAICTIADCGDTPSNWAPEARAAIHAVAAWFDAIGYGATASILRQEVERHG